MDYPEILWCKSCCKFVAVDGKLDRQGLKTVCIECGTEVDKESTFVQMAPIYQRVC